MKKSTYSSSEHTKLALAEALKELMAQKPFEKITIQELTARCGIRRQNFYYHFEDVYDLLQWMFHEEAISLLMRHEGVSLWQEGMLQLFQYLEDNRAVCLCALKSLGRDHIKRFFEDDIHSIIHKTIEEVSNEIGIDRIENSAADLELSTHFFVTALAGMVESWLLGEIDRTPKQLIAFIDLLLQNCVTGAGIHLQHHDNTDKNKAADD